MTSSRNLSAARGLVSPEAAAFATLCSSRDTMHASPYQSLVHAASKLAGMELREEVNDFTIGGATDLLERLSSTLDSAEAALRQECNVPVDYHANFLSYHMDDVQHLRNLSRAFRLACDVAAHKKDSALQARYGMATLDLANAVRRGGLIVDHLVAVAIAGVGVNGLRSVRSRCDNDLRRELITKLIGYERVCEPFHDIAERDAKWEEVVEYEEDSELPDEELFDPDSELPIEDQKELIRLIKASAARPRSEKLETYATLERVALAMSRLLTVDLALRSWQAASGRYPASLSQLMPDVLAAVPPDPFTGRDFIYRTTADSFMLYSVGPDRVDHGGRFGAAPLFYCGGYDLGLDAEDYPNGCGSLTPESAVARFCDWVRSLWRSR